MILYFILISCLLAKPTDITEIINRVGSLNQKPEADMSMIEMVAYHGYPCEHMYVRTPDGHLLDLYRITGPRGEKLQDKKADRRPVLMLHGILQSSFRWVLNGPNGESKAPAYQLADSGDYDVWLLNVRGNAFSREHSFLDADSAPKFWDFSFEEFGEIDVPAAISYILDLTAFE